MKWMHRIALSLVLALASTGQPLASRYELLLDNSTPTSGSIRLILDGPLRSDTHLTGRELEGSSIDNPICVTSGKSLLRQNSGWLAPAGCSEIAWNIEFNETVRPEHDVSVQKNLYYSGKWRLFSEWGNLLRPASGVAESEICTKGSITVCRRVPLLHEPPLLMLIGEPDKRVILGKTSFNFFTGHLPNGFDVEDLYESYDRQVSYLHKAIGATSTSPPPEAIDVLVLGIRSSLNVVGGAAGKDAYLANIAVNKQTIAKSERTRHLWIAGHEMAHMLGLGTEALWASESLAHYYGFKSLGENQQASRLFKEMEDEIGQIGLLEAHRLVAQGERQHYSQFYTKGAAFWRDVDEAITSATRGGESLDDYLPLLADGHFGENGELPPEFSQALIDVVGHEKVDRIYREYLGEI
jgi:hypothetical protein